MKNSLTKDLSDEEITILRRLKEELEPESWRELMKELLAMKKSENLLAERRWKTTAQTLIHLITLYSQIIKEEVGLDAYYKISTDVWSEIGKSVKNMLRPLKINQWDAASVHQGVRQFSQVIWGSELDFDVITASKDRSVIRIYHCPWHQIMIDTGLQSFCEPHHEVHETFCRNLVSALNPRLVFRFTQHTSHDRSYCEEIVEFDTGGVISP